MVTYCKDGQVSTTAKPCTKKPVCKEGQTSTTAKPCTKATTTNEDLPDCPPGVTSTALYKCKEPTTDGSGGGTDLDAFAATLPPLTPSTGSACGQQDAINAQKCIDVRKQLELKMESLGCPSYVTPKETAPANSCPYAQPQQSCPFAAAAAASNSCGCR